MAPMAILFVYGVCLAVCSAPLVASDTIGIRTVPGKILFWVGFDPNGRQP